MGIRLESPISDSFREGSTAGEGVCPGQELVPGASRRWTRASPTIDRISRPTLGTLLALSAGALVYVGASHLLPEVEKENRRFMISLAVGVLVALAIVAAKG